MKRFVLILFGILACVLLVSNFLGSKRAAESVMATAQTAVTAGTAGSAEAAAAPQVTSAPAQAASTAPDLDLQFDCIANHADMWKLSGDYTADPMYTVADLDGDGRLEVISAVCEGSGLYTTAWYYEVNEDASGLTALNYAVDEGDSEPDILSETADVYTGGAVHWYVFDDIIRNGMAEHIDIIYAIAKQGTEIRQQVIASDHFVADESTGAEADTYTDAMGNEITAEAFSTAAADFFVNCNHRTASFDWHTLAEGDDLAIFARESYTVFAGSSL